MDDIRAYCRQRGTEEWKWIPAHICRPLAGVAKQFAELEGFDLPVLIEIKTDPAEDAPWETHKVWHPDTIFLLMEDRDGTLLSSYKPWAAVRTPLEAVSYIEGGFMGRTVQEIRVFDTVEEAREDAQDD